MTDVRDHDGTGLVRIMHAIAHEPAPIRGVNHLSRRLHPLEDGPLHYGPECHWEDIALEWKRENSADFRAIGHEWSLADLSRMSTRGSAAMCGLPSTHAHERREAIWSHRQKASISISVVRCEAAMASMSIVVPLMTTVP